MALLALLGLLALVPACTLWGEHPVVNHWKDATGGQGLERSFWEDVKTRSWNDLSGHIAGNYVAITPQGRLDRAAALERLQHFDLKDYTLADVKTELHGNTFVVTYQLTLDGKLDDKPFSSEPLRVMTVWQQQKRGWVAIARTEM
jgi:hypothetical protein